MKTIVQCVGRGSRSFSRCIGHYFMIDAYSSPSDLPDMIFIRSETNSQFEGPKIIETLIKGYKTFNLQEKQ